MTSHDEGGIVQRAVPRTLPMRFHTDVHGAPPGHPEISQRMRPTPGVSRSEVHLLQSPCSPVFTQITRIKINLHAMVTSVY
jgi:hypothetical protein